MSRIRSLMLAVVAGVLLSTSGCGVVGGGNGDATITAYLPDSAGLFVGNDVGILGVPVGEITDLEPDGKRVRVTLTVDGDHQIPADAGAVVVARSVATDRYLELTPAYTSGPTMESGAEIPLDRTRTPVDFNDVLDSLNEFATGLTSSKNTTRAVQRFIDAGSKALDGNGELLNRSVTNLADGVGALNSQRDDIEAMVRSLDVLMGAMAKDETTVRRFINQVADASSLMASERKNFGAALRELKRAVAVVADFAVNNREEFVKALDGSTDVMRNVVAKEEELSEILQVMPLALQNFQRAEHDGKFDLRIDFAKVFPEGDVLRELCDGPLAAVCYAVGQ